MINTYLVNFFHLLFPCLVRIVFFCVWIFWILGFFSFFSAVIFLPYFGLPLSSCGSFLSLRYHSSFYLINCSMPALLSIISFLISLHHQLVSCQYLRLTFVHTSLFLFFLEDSLYCLDASAHPFISNLIAAHIRERKKEKCFYSLQNS